MTNGKLLRKLDLLHHKMMDNEQYWCESWTFSANKNFDKHIIASWIDDTKHERMQNIPQMMNVANDIWRQL